MGTTPSLARRKNAGNGKALRAKRPRVINAMVGAGRRSDRVFTLEGAEKACRVLIESTNEGALTLTTDGMILYANQRFARMVQSSPEQVLGGSFRRFLSAEDRALLRRLTQRAAESGQIRPRGRHGD